MKKIVFLILFVLPLTVLGATYSLPASLGSGIFSSCSGAGTTYSCSANITLGEDDILNLTQDLNLTINGNFRVREDGRINANGFTFNIDVTGNIRVNSGSNIEANLDANGDIRIDEDGVVTGNLTAGDDLRIDEDGVVTGDLSAGDDIDIREDVSINGDVTAGDNLTIRNNATVNGACSPSHPQCTGISSGGGGQTCETFLDQFSSTSYSRQDGTVNWASNWVEVSDNGRAQDGDIQISGGQLQLEGDGGGSTTLGGPYIYRDADLTPYTSATLSFDYSESGSWEGNDDIDIYVSPNGGGSWTRLRRFTNDQAAGTFTEDITGYIGSNTRIAFVELANSGSEIFYFDDVQIEACTSGAGGTTPLAWFQLDEISGSLGGAAGELIDQQGNFNSARALGTSAGTDAVPAQVCNGISVPLNTSNSAQYGIDTGIDVDADIGNQGSISFWYSSNTAWVGGGDRSLFDASPTTPPEYFLLSLRNDGSLVFGLEDTSDGDFRIYTGVQNIAANTWVHLAATWDINGERRLYLNGNLIGTESGTTNGTVGEFDTLYFGDNRSTYHPDGSANSANGIFDEIRVYQGVQTQAEIATDMNATHPCINSPVAEYRLDENSWSGVAGEVVDSSGNGLNGQAINGATPVPAQVCNGASLNGASYINIPDNSLLDINDELTVTAWIRPDTIPASELKTIVSKDENFEFHINSAGQLYWWWSWATLTTSGTPMTSGNWYHVAIVYSDASDLQEIYIDGALRASSNRSGTLQLNNDPLQIGADQGISNRVFDGLIDEVRVYNGALSSTQVNAVMNQTRVCPVSGLNHYVISHDGQGITCQAETITITGNDASDTPTPPEAGTTIELTTSVANDGWALISGNGTFSAPNFYTFDGSETTVQFALIQTSAVTDMDIDVLDGDGVGDLDDGGSEDPPLDFYDVGLEFSPIAQQTAGLQTSGHTLSILQTDPETGACVALANGPQTVEMAFECIDPATCARANGVTVIDSVIGGAGDILADNPQGGPINYSDVDLEFNVGGVATWNMVYVDAGEISLHAQLTIPGSGANDPTLVLNANSTSFVSTPAGICIEATHANSGCGVSTGINCSRFQAAGLEFDLSIRAVAWEVAGETNAAFCTGNSITPNFQLSNIPLTLSLVSPSDGVNGLLGITTANISAGEVTLNQTINEVGIFQISTPNLDYLGITGAIPASTSNNIGRFIPSNFSLTNGLIVNRSGLAGVSSFSYLGEDFDISYTLTAFNAASPPEQTRNYSDGLAEDFARLDSVVELGYVAVDTQVPVTDLTARLTISPAPTINWVNGVLSMSHTARIERDTTVDGPFNLLSIGIDPTDEDTTTPPVPRLDSYDLDADGDSTDDHGLIDTTEVRYGRMRLQNVFGSELISLTMPMLAEYFDGTSFVRNSDDNLTPLAISNLSLSNNVESAQVDGDIQVLAGQTSQIDATVFNNPLALGDANLVFCPPGNPACTPTAGNSGYIDVTLNLSAYPYLQYNWDTLLPGDENPQGRASFGIYDGNSRQIYYRRIYQ